MVTKVDTNLSTRFDKICVEKFFFSCLLFDLFFIQLSVIIMISVEWKSYILPKNVVFLLPYRRVNHCSSKINFF